MSNASMVCAQCESLEPRRLLSAELLKDINFTSLGTTTSTVLATEEHVYVWSADGVHRSDGTLAGSKRVLHDTRLDTLIGVAGVGGNDAVLIMRDYLEELWFTDGTTDGAVQVMPPEVLTIHTGSPIISDGGDAFFVGDLPGTPAGYSIIRTDGTQGGTVALASGFTPSSWLVATDSHVFFFAETWDGADDPALHAVDRTTGAVEKVMDGEVLQYARFGEELLFIGGPLEDPYYAFWKSDGTAAGTTKVEDIVGLNGLDSNGIVVSGGKAFVALGVSGLGAEIWVSDGTAAGTGMIKELQPGNANGALRPRPITGGVVFEGWNAPESRARLFFTDGTVAGTRAIIPHSGSGSESLPVIVRDWTSTDGNLFLLLPNGQLHVTDGTDAGTRRITTATPTLGAVGSRSLLGGLNGNVLYAGSDAIRGSNLHLSDGTNAGTGLLYMPRFNTNGSDIADWTPSGTGRAYFTATNGLTATQVWTTDGTPAGTQPLTSTLDVNASIRTIMPLNEGVAFTASTPTTPNAPHRRRLFVSDGTNPAAIVSDAGGLITARDGRWYFYLGTTIYSTGSTGDIRIEGNVPAQLSIHEGVLSDDGLLYLDGNLSSTGARMFALNLATGQFDQVTPTAPFSLIEGTLQFLRVGSNVLAMSEAEPIALYTRLFRLDGALAYPLLPNGDAVITFGEAFVVNNVAYFIAAPASNAHSRQVWRSDGTDAGTYPLTSFLSSELSPVSLMEHQGALYFVNNVSGESVRGIYRVALDGSGATRITSQRPDRLEVGPDGSIYYLAPSPDDPAGAKRLYSTDGTAAGTTEVAVSLPSGFGLQGRVGDHLLFMSPSGYRPYGRELYRFGGDASRPASLSIVRPDPDRRNTPLSEIRIGFAEEVSGFDLGDMELRRDGTLIPLAGVNIATSDQVNFTVQGLDALTTQRGVYELTVRTDGSGILNLGSIPLTGSASTTWRKFVRGDVNDDGAVNNLDIAPFVTLLTSPSAFATAYPGVDPLLVGDINGDGAVNNLDIAPFVALLTGGRTEAVVPPPGGVSGAPIRPGVSPAPITPGLFSDESVELLPSRGRALSVRV